MRVRIKSTCLTLTLAAGVVVTTAGAAMATEGYFRHGYGARHEAMGGAGVADGRDSTTIALNPAALWRAGNEFTMAVSGFMPFRSMEGSGAPGFTPSGKVESGSEFFLVPNMSWSYRLAPGSIVDAVGFSVYGNGGMNTDFGGLARTTPPCPPGATGIFCGGRLGVNLQQAFISFAMAKRFGSVSVGVAPIVARQQFEAEGLGLFGVSGSVTDVSWGYGARAGIEWQIAPGLRLGVAGNTRVYMEKFDKYARLFAGQGDFDIPASLQAGIAFDVNPHLTLMADYKRIWYGSVASIANPSANAFIAPFGAGNGPGFGWRDIDIFKVGLEWRASRKLTLRAGYAYNTSPIRSADVMLNILAPGVVQHHITGGFEYKLNRKLSLEAAVFYAPEATVSGVELPPPFGNPAHRVQIAMDQLEVTVGIKYRWGAPEAAIEPLK
ncbi:MAG: outer membrane protein transport protein [Hyphomicrobiaceae bacterium]